MMIDAKAQEKIILLRNASKIDTAVFNGLEFIYHSYITDSNVVGVIDCVNIDYYKSQGLLHEEVFEIRPQLFLVSTKGVRYNFDDCTIKFKR